jgi:hypothetical protein
VLEHVIDAKQHVVVPISHHAQPQRLEEACAALIVAGVSDVLSAVQFHDQQRVEADEVDDASAENILPPELEARQLAIAQAKP